VSSEHAAYLADLSNALTQEPSTEFGPTPSGFIFTNPLGSERLGPAPALGVDLTESACVRHNLKWSQIISQDGMIGAL